MFPNSKIFHPRFDSNQMSAPFLYQLEQLKRGTNETPSAIFPSPTEQFKFFQQQLQFFNLARLSFMQQHNSENSSKIETSENSEAVEEVELRVGARVLSLRRSENDSVISQEHQNDDLGDILIYSVSTPSGQCYHTVTYNGGESRQMGHDIELTPAQLKLLPHSTDQSEANLILIKMSSDSNTKCQALKTIDPGDELIILDSDFSGSESLTPHKNDMETALQFFFAANQLAANSAKEKKTGRGRKLQDMTTSPNLQDGEASESGYQCERCGKVFTYAYYRDKHLKYTRCVDNGDRKYPCSQCSRSFEKRDRLRIHILHVHENHRPHVCNACGKAFSQSSSLNKHLRVHSGERPYHCPDPSCNKSFTASSILRTHIRQHSGEKPFKCSFCGKAFASHAAHDSHVRRTHTVVDSLGNNDSNAEIHQCPKCDKCFSAQNHLDFHLETVHASR